MIRPAPAPAHPIRGGRGYTPPRRRKVVFDGIEVVQVPVAVPADVRVKREAGAKPALPPQL
ncbi:MAG: hypothetical protein Kow0020_01680 [Wenzhouxiangellaceae bacterium]